MNLEKYDIGKQDIIFGLFIVVLTIAFVIIELSFF